MAMANAATKAATPVNNGVNVDALLGARTALTDSPGSGLSSNGGRRFRWINGTHSQSTVEDLLRPRREAAATRPSSATIGDHPEVFASEDNGATPGRVRAGRAWQAA